MKWPHMPLEHLSVLGPQYGANVKAVSPLGARPRYVRITDIDDWGRLRPKSIAEPDGDDLDMYMLNDGDILLARSGATVGKSYLYSAADGPCVFAGYLIRFRLDKQVVEPRYVRYFLQTPSYWSWIASKKRVAAQPNVNGAEYASLRIPLPAPSEQRRIVEILDQADALRKLRAEADAKAERILPTLFIKMFGDPLSWCSHPSSRPLGDLVNLASGATPSKRNEEFWGGDIPWVSPKDMKVDFIIGSQDHVTATALDQTNLKLVDPGNVLLVVRGMILAHSVPVALTRVPVTINQDMKALVPKIDEITGKYLWATLKVAKPLLQSLVRTAAHGTRKLDTPDLLQLPVIEPSAQQIKECESAVNTHRTLLEASATRREKLNLLFDVLLHRAFTGDLTASWREAHMKELLQEMEQQAKALGGQH